MLLRCHSAVRKRNKANVYLCLKSHYSFEDECTGALNAQCKCTTDQRVCEPETTVHVQHLISEDRSLAMFAPNATLTARRLILFMVLHYKP